MHRNIRVAKDSTGFFAAPGVPVAAVATEERAGLGLGPFDPLSLYALAREHGIPVYPIDELSDGTCPPEAMRHFTVTRPEVWSAALVPAGPGRFILENTAHSRCRRCSSLAHELSHHLLEHPFDNILCAAAAGGGAAVAPCRAQAGGAKTGAWLCAGNGSGYRRLPSCQGCDHRWTGTRT
jgi:hypothetical protein